MKSLYPAIILLALASSLGFAKTELADTPRRIVSLDADWKFHLGDLTNAIHPAYNDQDWRRVDVPHDYVIEGTFTETNPYPQPGDRASWYWLHGFLPTPPAWYCKTLSLPAADQGKRLWLEFDGVFSNSRYWLNGREIGSQYSGYNRFQFDITDAVKFGGQNILSVRVAPRWDGWWYEGGGIYRHVRLVIVDPVHVAPEGIFVAPAVADPGNGIQTDATVAVHTDVTNETSAPVTAMVLSEILDADGKVILSAPATQSLAASADANVAQSLALPKRQTCGRRTSRIFTSCAAPSACRARSWIKSPRALACGRFVLTPRAGFFLEWQACQAQGSHDARGSRRRWRGDARPAHSMAAGTAEGGRLQRHPPVAQSRRTGDAGFLRPHGVSGDRRKPSPRRHLRGSDAERTRPPWNTATSPAS
jgi:hypothetical protein